IKLKRSEKKKKKVSSNMSVIILSWVDKGTCEHNTVYWHQVSLHQAGVGWGFGTVIFKVHPFSFFKSLSHPISPVLKKKGVNVLL
ncbi:hypothetical protein, partial [Thiolapillus sp.]|uniref:hypothetical protein n=1 Tax=Thiolapillus sp. TaxID=2017437 RepID=UPI003AF754B4